MKQKVSLARAIIHDPPVLIFDEPTAGLDVLVQRSVLDAIRHLRAQGRCILFSTHIMREVEKMCDRVAILHRGRILACGTLDELRADNLIAMQEGAGVRQLLEDELRRIGKRLRDLGVRLELGLQESVLSAVRSGHGVTFISRRSVEADLTAGTLAEARVEGLELERDVFLVRATGRVETRAAKAFLEFARDRL